MAVLATEYGILTFIEDVIFWEETDSGPGDIETYFPIELGISWTYDVTESESDKPHIAYGKEV